MRKPIQASTFFYLANVNEQINVIENGLTFTFYHNKDINLDCPFSIEAFKVGNGYQINWKKARFVGETSQIEIIVQQAQSAVPIPSNLIGGMIALLVNDAFKD